MKNSVLISGNLVTKDLELIEALQINFELVITTEISEIPAFLAKGRIDAVIIENSEGCPLDLGIIKEIKEKYKNTKIILIDNDRDELIKAFQHGVNEAFRKPYISKLLAERTKALIQE